MLSLQVPDQEIVDRLLLRGQVSGRADDANEEVIRNRIRIYKEQTEPVEQYYAAQGKFVAIDGVGTIDEIFGRLCEAIDKL
jgi:adenylate kinase